VLPPLMAAPPPPPLPFSDSAERATPLQVPAADLIASTAEASFEVPTARDAFQWKPPAPGASSPAIGGAMLERYGDSSTGKTRALVLVVLALVAAGTAAFLLLR